MIVHVLVLGLVFGRAENEHNNKGDEGYLNRLREENARGKREHYRSEPLFHFFVAKRNAPHQNEENGDCGEREGEHVGYDLEPPG